jgi:hypothetical protein
MTEAKWIRFVHNPECVKEILDYCEAEKKKERERLLREVVILSNQVAFNRTVDRRVFDAGIKSLCAEAHK